MCPQFCLKIKDGCYVCQCGGMTSLLYAFIGQKIKKYKKYNKKKEKKVCKYILFIKNKIKKGKKSL